MDRSYERRDACAMQEQDVRSRSHLTTQKVDQRPMDIHAWHSKITQYLHQIGFCMSKSDNSLYIRSDSASPIVIILYVDDLIIGGEHFVEINRVKSLLSDKFEVTDMKELHYFLGIKVIQTPDGIMICQRHYILNLLYKFGMAECQSMATPHDRNLKLDADSGTKACEPT